MPARDSISWLLVGCVIFSAGCGAVERRWDKGTTWGALTGLLVGGGAGVAAANAGFGQHEDSKMARGGAIGAATGAVVGGLIGHYVFDPPVELPEEDFVVPPPEPPQEVAVIEESVVEPLEAGEVLAVVRDEEPVDGTSEVSGFAFGSAILPPVLSSILDGVALRLANDPGAAIIVEGHTDSVGAASFNYELGRRRAQNVADYLIAKGVSPSRISVVSAGENAPVASNGNEAGRRRNRRVEIRVADDTYSQPEPDPQIFESVDDTGAVPVGEVPAAVETTEPTPTSIPISSADYRIYFDQDQFAVSAPGQQKLDEIAAEMKADPALVLDLVGHTDPSETEVGLPSLRAARVRLELINRGVDLGRIRTRSARAAEPGGNTPSLNRRVEASYQ